MTDSQTTQSGNVFISYSRRDKSFVQKLHSGLESIGAEAWVDWDSIPLTADWMAEIKSAIEGADAFVFVISPDSLNSKICIEEIELGVQNNKKFVPILYREPGEDDPVPLVVAATNWVFLRDQDDFDATLPKLLEAINTDLEWVKQHTRILQRAVEWDEEDRNSSFLLRGEDLASAENWQMQASVQEGRQITKLQAEYIRASRQDAIRRQRIMLVGISAALIATILLAVYAFFQRNIAVEKQQFAQEQQQIAEQQRAIAVEQQQYAEQQKQVAEEQRGFAEEQRSVAEEQRAIAEEQRSVAIEQGEIALAQKIVAQAQLQQQASQLQVSTLLAIDSIWRRYSPEGGQVLRQNLTLLPVPLVGVAHENWVNAVAFGADGSRLATASDDQTIRIWDASSAEQILVIEAQGEFLALDFSPDGKRLAGANADATARVWDATSGEQLLRLQHDDVVNDVRFSPDGGLLATASDDFTARLWDASSGVELATFEHNGEVLDLDFSDDGHFLASASLNFAHIWSITAASQYNLLRHDYGYVFAVDISPDGSLVATAGEDHTARVWDLNTGEILYNIVHDDWVNDVEFSPDGEWMASASDDDQVHLLHLKSGFTNRMQHEYSVVDLEFSPDGQWLASTSLDHTARLWEVVSGNLEAVMSLNAEGSALAFSRDSGQLATASEDGSVLTWDVAATTHSAIPLIHPVFVQTVALSPDGTWAATGSDDYTVRLWRVEAPQVPSETVTSGVPLALEFSPDGERLAVGDAIGQIQILELSTGKALAQFYQNGNSEATITDIAYSPDGERLATADWNGTVVVWDLGSGASISLTHEAGIAALAFSPDGKWLATASGKRATVWDADSGEIAAQGLVSDKDLIQDLAFSPDGSTLVTAQGVKAAIWELEAVLKAGDFGAVEYKELLHLDLVNEVAFSPSGEWMITATRDGMISFWDPEIWFEVSRLNDSSNITALAVASRAGYFAYVRGRLAKILSYDELLFLKPDRLIEEACKRVTRNLTADEWERYIGESDPYRATCHNLPLAEQ